MPLGVSEPTPHPHPARRAPYKDSAQLESAVATGAVREAGAVLAQRFRHDPPSEVQWFYNVTCWFLLAFAVITVLALIGLSGRRRWDAALFALAPGLALTGTINWDLIAVGLTAAGMLAWARKWHWTAGALLGLGSATKLYPSLLLFPLSLPCWRAARMR